MGAQIEILQKIKRFTGQKRIMRSADLIEMNMKLKQNDFAMSQAFTYCVPSPICRSGICLEVYSRSRGIMNGMV